MCGGERLDPSLVGVAAVWGRNERQRFFLGRVPQLQTIGGTRDEARAVQHPAAVDGETGCTENELGVCPCLPHPAATVIARRDDLGHMHGIEIENLTLMAI